MKAIKNSDSCLSLGMLAHTSFWNHLILRLHQLLQSDVDWDFYLVFVCECYYDIACQVTVSAQFQDGSLDLLDAFKAYSFVEEVRNL